MICDATSRACSGVSASLMPPPLPRPPAWICALTTTGPPSSFAMARGFFGGVGHAALRHGHAVLREQFFGLVFVDLHRGSFWRSPRTSVRGLGAGPEALQLRVGFFGRGDSLQRSRASGLYFVVDRLEWFSRTALDATHPAGHDQRVALRILADDRRVDRVEAAGSAVGQRCGGVVGTGLDLDVRARATPGRRLRRPGGLLACLAGCRRRCRHLARRRCAGCASPGASVGDGFSSSGVSVSPASGVSSGSSVSTGDSPDGVGVRVGEASSSSSPQAALISNRERAARSQKIFGMISSQSMKENAQRETMGALARTEN